MNSDFHDLKNNRILIIDDNPAIHDDIRKILGSEGKSHDALAQTKELLFGGNPLPLDESGFEIVSAFQGQEGLEKVKEAEEAGRPFALMFVDMRMPPGWDGVETIKRIWQLYPQLQVVVCTAYSDYSWGEMIEHIGKSDSMVILKKPFDNIEVMQLAHALTEKWNLTHEVKGRLKNLDYLVSQRTAELRSANAQLLDVQRIARLGSYCLDVRTGRFTTSEVLDELFGIVNSGLTKDVAGWLQLVHPQDREEMQRYLNEEVLNGQSAFDRHYRIVRHNDQQERCVHGLGKVILNERGQPIQMIGTIQDITERKRAEDALSDSCELFSLFMRYSPICTYIKDVTPNESRVIQASDNFQQMIGLSGLDMQGKIMSELFPPEFAAKMTADDWAVVAKGDVLKADEDLNGRNYTTIKYPIVMRGKTLLAGYTIDITERKRAEEAKEKLEFQNRQLQKAESLGRMAGAIAHHFNNQLQAVMTNLQLAMQDVPKNAQLVETLTEAMQSALKAAEVSTLMLTYLGQASAKHEPLYLCDTCQRHLPMLRTAVPQSVVLETDLSSPSPIINANANQLQQILTNLITNAWEAMGETQGVIRLIVKTVQAADIPSVNRFPIDCQVQDHPYACLEVADAGCGIADKDIEKVFDPFFSTKFVGRGLGLSVVVGIAQAHGGCVTVESRPSKGSVFRVFLPLSSEAISQKSALVAQVPKTADGGTVLVIDDESPLRKAVLLALKRSGFTVLEAKDGVEGVEVFQQHSDEICCVLCDMTMPRMNGWETLTALRKLAPEIPVILASGYSREQVMAGNHPELPQAFLSKPYEFATLKDTIVRFMRKPDQTLKKT